MEFKTGGRDNGQRLYNASKFLDYLENIETGKMYGIQKCSKGITILTNEEVIIKKNLIRKIDEKIYELKKISITANDNIERTIAKGMAEFSIFLKNEILKE